MLWMWIWMMHSIGSWMMTIGCHTNIHIHLNIRGITITSITIIAITIIAVTITMRITIFTITSIFPTGRMIRPTTRIWIHRNEKEGGKRR